MANQSVRTLQTALWVSGIALPTWDTGLLYSFTSGTGIVPIDIPLSSQVLDGVSIYGDTIYVSGGNFGFSSVVSDDNNGLWLLTFNGAMIHLESNGTATLANIVSGNAYVGTALVSGNAYAVDSEGFVWMVSGSGSVQVSGGFESSVRCVISANDEIYALLPNFQGTFDGGIYGTSDYGNALYGGTISSPSFGILSFTDAILANLSVISIPTITHPSVMAVDGITVAIAGWTEMVFSGNQTSLFPFNSGAGSTAIIGLNPANNLISLYLSMEGYWDIAQQVSGSGSPTYGMWDANGSHIYVTDPGNNLLEYWQFSGGALSNRKTIPITSPGPLDLSTTDTLLVVTQPTLNQISLYSGNATLWNFQGTTSVSGVASVFALSGTEFVFGYSGGLSWYSYNGISLVLIDTLALSFVPDSLMTDTAGNLYAAGTTGGTSHIAIVSPQKNLIQQISWSGSFNGFAWQQDQLFVLDANSNAIYTYAPLDGNWSLENTTTTVSGATNLAQGYAYLYVASPVGIWQYEYGTPFELFRTMYGYLGIFNGSSWNVVDVGAHDRASAITFDPSGNIWIAHENNMIFEFDGNGNFLQKFTVIPPPPQPQTVPLGISSLTWFGGSLYGGSSIANQYFQVI